MRNGLVSIEKVVKDIGIISDDASMSTSRNITGSTSLHGTRRKRKRGKAAPSVSDSSSNVVCQISSSFDDDVDDDEHDDSDDISIRTTRIFKSNSSRRNNGSTHVRAVRCKHFFSYFSFFFN